VEFAPSGAQDLREPVRAFIRERIVPRESELIAAIDDEVAPGVAYPAAIRELRARGGLWNLWLGGAWRHHEPAMSGETGVP